MEQPKVSVVIPVYGVEKYIERCARSLFEQTMQEGIEFIFIDDCSPDRSIEIRHSENQGSGGTRKTGVENATGEYIIHCDSDDWVEPDMYETLYRKGTEESADIVGCDFIYAYQRKHVIVKQPFPSDNIQCLSDMFSGRLQWGMWTKLIRKSIYSTLRKHGYESFSIGINMGEDMAMMPRLIYLANKIVYVSQPLYYYRQNRDSYTHNWNAISVNNVMDALSINYDFFSKRHIDISSLITISFFNILTSVSKKDREIYFDLFLKRFPLDFTKIDYTIFRSFHYKFYAWSLFNKQYFVVNIIEWMMILKLKLCKLHIDC